MNYVFPLLAAFLWGVNTLVSKLTAGAISPSEIAFLRWLIAAAVMLPLAIRPVMHHRKVVIAHAWQLAILGVLGGVVYQSLAYSAASYTSAINMGVIQALVPLITIMVASLMFRVAPSASTIIGTLISLLGVLIVISGGHLQSLAAHGINRGDGMMLVGVSSMSVYNALLKRWHLDVPLLVSMFVQALSATIVLLPFYIAADKHALTWATSGMVLYAALGASIAAPLAWMAGSRRLGPSRVSLFFNVVPIVTAVLAVLLLSERFTWSLLIGGTLALAGVIVVEAMRLSGSKPTQARA